MKEIWSLQKSVSPRNNDLTTLRTILYTVLVLLRFVKVVLLGITSVQIAYDFKFSRLQYVKSSRATSSVNVVLVSDVSETISFSIILG
jgi:hypothetical protein